MRLVFPCSNRLQLLQFMRASLVMMEMIFPLMMTLPRELTLMMTLPREMILMMVFIEFNPWLVEMSTPLSCSKWLS